MYTDDMIEELERVRRKESELLGGVGLYSFLIRRAAECDLDRVFKSFTNKELEEFKLWVTPLLSGEMIVVDNTGNAFPEESKKAFIQYFEKQGWKWSKDPEDDNSD